MRCRTLSDRPCIIMAMAIRQYIDRLVWDAWNRDHLEKHAVSPEEVVEVAAAEPVIRTTYKGRFQLIGITLAGRTHTVIVGPMPTRPEAYDVFSARPASRKERQYFEQQNGASSP